VLNIPEHVDPLGAFHVEQGFAGGRVPVLQLFDFVPLEPEAAATVGAGQDFDAGDGQGFQFVVARWAIHGPIIDEERIGATSGEALTGCSRFQ